MKINKLNYEAYAIDYLEGTLSSTDRESFELLMGQYPDIKQELDDYLEAPVMEDDGEAVFLKRDTVIQKRGYGKWLLALMFLLSLVVIAGLMWMQQDVASSEAPIRESDHNTEGPHIETREALEDKSPLMANESDPADAKLVNEEVRLTQKELAIEETNRISTDMIKGRVSEASLSKVLPVIELKREESQPQEFMAVTESNDLIENTVTPVAVSNLVASEEAVVQLALVKRLDFRAVAMQLPISTASNAAPLLSVALSTETIMADVETKQNKKKSKWLKVLTPQLYNNLNLKEAIAFTHLKSAGNEIEMAIVPESLNTK